VDEVQAVLKCGQGRQGSDQSPVEDARSLASAEDEDPQGRSWPARRQAVEFIPDGIAQADGLARKNGRLSSKATTARLTQRASIRLVKPGRTFCSMIRVGLPSQAAVRTTGPEL